MSNLAAWKFRNLRRLNSAENAVGITVSRLGINKKLKDYSAVMHWAEIVGNDLSELTKIEKIIRGNILVIRVKDSCISPEVMMRKNEIIERFNSYSTTAMIEDVRVISGSPMDFKK